MTTEAATPTDRELLGRFCAGRDEAAFNQLVARHEGMVRQVARRVLGDPTAAEDVLQATLFVLATRADRLQRQGGTPATLGPWLNRVATNAALQVRRSNQARVRREQVSARNRPTLTPEAESDTAEALPLLDEELLGLPDRLRAPLVLCCLEGTPLHEAAAALGLSFGTLRRRLDEGRERLRGRLLRRGVALSAATLTLLLSDPTAHATPPAAPKPEAPPTFRREASELGRSVLDQMERQPRRRRIVAGLALAGMLLGGLVVAASAPRADGPAGAGRSPARPVAPRRPGHTARPAPATVVARPSPAAPEQPAEPEEIDAEPASGFFVGELQINGVTTRFDDQAAFERALRTQGLGGSGSLPRPDGPVSSDSREVPSSSSTAPVASPGVSRQGGVMAGGSVSASVSVSGRCCCERLKERSTAGSPATRPASCMCRPCPTFPDRNAPRPPAR